MIKQFKKDKRFWWIALGIFTIILRSLASWSPELVESIYSRGIFIVIRNVIDHTIARSPIPLFYILLIGLVIWMIVSIVRSFKTQKSIGKRLANFGLNLLTIASIIVFLFLFLWGFNYARIPIETQINIDARKLNFDELKTELDDETEQLIAIIEEGSINWADSLRSTEQIGAFETEMRNLVIQTLKKIDYPTPGKVRGRILKPKGILLRFSTAGVYLPWIGEGHIDGGLHPLQKPFTMAHELSHAYGFGDEGSCNFIAYLACISSSNAYINYSGHLGYWRYLASNYRFSDRENYKNFYQKLPVSLKADLVAIRKNSLKYPDILPDLRDVAYDTYLKTQGIKEGLQNYSRVILLVRAYKQSKHFTH